MTVSTTTTRAVLSGNGVTTSFPFAFNCSDTSTLVVTFTNASGTSTVVTGSCTITLNSDQAASPGGTVVYNPGTPIATGTTLTISRSTPQTQLLSILNQDAFLPATVMAEFDKLTRIVQEEQDQIARVVQGPVTDPVGLSMVLPAVAQRANQLLGFNGSGQPIASQPSSALVSAAMQPVVAAATTGAAAALLGSVSTSNANTFTARQSMSGAAFEEAARVDVASAATVDLDAAAANYVRITGTTTIGAITLAAGRRRQVVFGGVLQITNGASLILPGAANITTAAGDCMIVEGEAASVVRVIDYQRADGTALALPASLVTATPLRMNTARLLGRTTAAVGTVEEIAIGSGLAMTAGTLSATGATGGRTSISSGSLSGTTLSLTSIPATFSYLVLQITGMSFSGSVTPTLRPSTNNGSSYDSTAGNYSGIRTNIDSTPTTTTAKIATASMLESHALAGSDTCDATITIKPYAGGTWAQWTAVISDSAGNVSTVIGVYKSTSAINALQLAGGTFDAGSYQFDGVS